MGNSDLLQSWATPRGAKSAANDNRPSNSERGRDPAASGKGIGRCLLRHNPLWSDDFSNRPACLGTSRSP